MPPKCSRKERRRGFSNRSIVDAAMSGRSCVFLGESKSTLFGLLKVDAIRNHWLRFIYNTTAQPKCSNLCNAFYGWLFHEPSRVQGWLCTKAISKKKGSILTLLWQSGASESATVCFVISSSICYWLFKCGVLHVTCFVCVCVCVCEGKRVTSQRSVQPVRNRLNRGLCSANTYEHHHCVCHVTLFPFRAWTDKTNLKAEAHHYGKGRYISDACLWCSANHNALGQLANQSRLRLSEGGVL